MMTFVRVGVLFAALNIPPIAPAGAELPLDGNVDQYRSACTLVIYSPAGITGIIAGNEYIGQRRVAVIVEYSPSEQAGGIAVDGNVGELRSGAEVVEDCTTIFIRCIGTFLRLKVLLSKGDRGM